MAVEEPDDALDEGQMHHPHYSEQGDYEKLFYSEAARENKLSTQSAKVSITRDNPIGPLTGVNRPERMQR